MPDLLFHRMIEQLRIEEQVVLYERILSVSDEEAEHVKQFLHTEYKRELPHHQHNFPAFNPEAALWGAKTAYIAAQLIIFRQNNNEELVNLLPGYSSEINSSAIVSADLCLRFIPSMLKHLKDIDSEDALIDVLEELLLLWNYSGLTYTRLDPDKIDLEKIINDKILFQLYCERIIHQRNMAWANIPAFNEHIGAQLGVYSQDLWKEFKRTSLTI